MGPFSEFFIYSNGSDTVDPQFRNGDLRHQLKIISKELKFCQTAEFQFGTDYTLISKLISGAG